MGQNCAAVGIRKGMFANANYLAYMWKEILKEANSNQYFKDSDNIENAWQVDDFSPESGDLAFITVGTEFSELRTHLARLKSPENSRKIYDFGFLALEDTETSIHALDLCLEDLREKGLKCIVVSTSPDLIKGHYNALRNRQELVSVTSISPGFDLQDNEFKWFNELITGEDGFLYRFALLGHQAYFCDQDSILAVQKMGFDTLRLGELRTRITVSEPLFRDSDIVDFRLSSIRSSDCPGSNDPSPNGLYAEEACQLMRYAGMGDHLFSIGISGLPADSNDVQSSLLCAQMIWHAWEGVSMKRDEMPGDQPANFQRFLVDLESQSDGIVFWKSTKTHRWWIELPDEALTKFDKFKYLPCSYDDYLEACEGDLPDAWMKAYTRLGFE